MQASLVAILVYVKVWGILERASKRYKINKVQYSEKLSNFDEIVSIRTHRCLRIFAIKCEHENTQYDFILSKFNPVLEHGFRGRTGSQHGP